MQGKENGIKRKNMKHQESKASILFRHWIKANPRISGSYEIKDSRGKSSISFSEITQQQLDYGLAIKSKKGVFIRVQGVNGEPDYIYLRNAPAYIVIKYPQQFSIIDIEAFILEKERSKRKSLTADRARAISITTIAVGK